MESLTWGCGRTRVCRAVGRPVTSLPCSDSLLGSKESRSREAWRLWNSAWELKPLGRVGGDYFGDRWDGGNPILIKASHLPSGGLGSKFPESWCQALSIIAFSL